MKKQRKKTEREEIQYLVMIAKKIWITNSQPCGLALRMDGNNTFDFTFFVYCLEKNVAGFLMVIHTQTCLCNLLLNLLMYLYICDIISCMTIYYVILSYIFNEISYIGTYLTHVTIFLSDGFLNFISVQELYTTCYHISLNRKCF